MSLFIKSKDIDTIELQRDWSILSCFSVNKIPSFIVDESAGNYDLMFYFKELLNYTCDLLDDPDFDLSVSSFGSDKPVVFSHEYRHMLIELSNNTNNIDLKIQCYFSLAVLSVLSKYAKHE